ncbi:MAG: permease-like cell division protein FtsX [Dysgonamonadaceae bacterium]|jgi:cell division transport system permease protein|nr:permease-like cell division protein FtsX [Dysgonamonadaceae bacterium]
MKKKQILSPATFINSKITAMVSIAFVLFLLGLIIFLSLFANNLTNHIKETLSFDIVLQDDTNQQQIQHIQDFLKETPYAKSVAYIPKEEAIKQLEEDLGQNPEEFLGFNPLPNLIVVHLNARYAHVDSLAVISHQLQAFSNNIKETEYREETVQLIGENIAKVGFLLLVIAILLMFISFAIINNTIRLMVYSKRFLIYTMQLVGAKKSFIRNPFIISNIGIGVIAAGIASGLLYWLISYMTNSIPDMHTLYNTQSLLIVFGSVLILGILITIISTYLAVNRYVGADVEDLYKM